MKVNSSIRKFWEFTKNGSDKKQLAVIYGFALLATFVIVTLFTVSIQTDTPSYIGAGNNILNGIIDEMRTPVYPLIYMLSEVICVQFPFRVLFVIQLVSFYISIFYMYKLCGLLINSRTIRFVVTLFYACSPNFILWTTIMLTESLSVSLLIIFCYTVIHSYKTGVKQYAAYNFLLLATLVFLRPIFIFLVPIVLLLWLYVLVREGRLVVSAVMNLFFIMIFCGIYLSYCKAYENRYGIFATSFVSDINQYTILDNIGLTRDASAIKDKRMRSNVETWLKENKDTLNDKEFGYKHFEFIRDNYGRTALQHYIRDTIKGNLSKYITYRIEMLRFALYDCAIAIYLHTPYKTIHTCVYLYRASFPLTLHGICWLLVISGVLFSVFGIKQHKMPLCSFFLWAIVSANFVTALIGALGEYPRLILPSLPMLFIIVAMLMDMITVKIKSDYKIQ